MIKVGLFHAPMNNKRGEEVATSITNIDIHDIARSGVTFGISEYFVVHPLAIQVQIAKRIAHHWRQTSQKDYNMDRSDAFKIINFAKDFDEVKEKNPGFTFIATSAKPTSKKITYAEVREKIKAQENIFIGFGTGHGMTNGLLEKFDYCLEPVHGPTNYNHLSVRSAAAVIMDRLLGR